jgi:hypothetical protein
MKQAFEAFWQPSQKRFSTPEEFVDFASSTETNFSLAVQHNFMAEMMYPN